MPWHGFVFGVSASLGLLFLSLRRARRADAVFVLAATAALWLLVTGGLFVRLMTAPGLASYGAELPTVTLAWMWFQDTAASRWVLAAPALTAAAAWSLVKSGDRYGSRRTALGLLLLGAAYVLGTAAALFAPMLACCSMVE